MEHGKITTKMEEFSPAQAQYSIMHEGYDRQRKLNQSYVSQYALEMRQGLWLPISPVVFAIVNGRRVLINGNHRLHAVVLAGCSVGFITVSVPLSSYEAIAPWYTSFDRLNQRTLAQAYQTHNLEAELRLNASQTKKLGSALPLLASGFEPVYSMPGSMKRQIQHHKTRMAFIREWCEELRQFWGDIKGAPGAMSSNLRSAPILAVALIHYRYTGTDATEFWHAVATADCLPQNDPRHRLHMHIRTSKIPTYDQDEYSRIVTRAWNATWNNRTPQSLQAESRTAPLRIEGTPHTGTEVLRYLTPEGEILHDPQPVPLEAWQQPRVGRIQGLLHGDNHNRG